MAAANVNQAYGLRAERHFAGGVIRHARYEIASALASNIYRGSAVKAVGTNKRIDVAAAGDRLIGVFDGMNYIDANGDTQYRPRWLSGQVLQTGSVAEVLVYDDPFILFSIQVSTVTGLAPGDIGAIANLVIGTGSAQTGNSGDMLDQTTITSVVATGGQLFIEELFDVQGNSYGQYAKALVRINQHQKFGSTTAGQAVMAY